MPVVEHEEHWQQRPCDLFEVARTAQAVQELGLDEDDVFAINVPDGAFSRVGRGGSRRGPAGCPAQESPACGMSPGGVAADGCVVDTTDMNQRGAMALNDDELLQAAATVMEELRRRGLLFAALAAIVDWQDKMFLEDNGMA